MPNWLLGIITPLIDRLVKRIGESIINKIKDSIKTSKALKEYEQIKDPQTRAALIKAYLNK